MAAVAFDTFKFVDRLEKAGLTRSQAVAISEAQSQSFAEALDATLATKSDVRDVRDELRDVKDELKADIGAVHAEVDLLRKDMLAMELRLEASTKADIARLEGRVEKMELRLVIKLGALMATISGLSIAVLVAILKLMH